MEGFHDPLWDRLDLSAKGHMTQPPAQGATVLEYFWPRAEMQAQVRTWKEVAGDQNRTYRGLQDLDESMLLAFMAVSILQGYLGVRSREAMFPGSEGIILNKSVWCRHISLDQYKALTSLIGHEGFHQYEVNHQMPDGRQVQSDDQLHHVRRFTDTMFKTFRRAYVPGPLLVVDETMIEWTGASVIYTIYISNKPRPEGICIKTVVDGNSRVLLAGEIVEDPYQMGLKYTGPGAGKVASTTLRVVWPDRNSTIKRVILADAWFGNVATARVLQRYNFE